MTHLPLLLLWLAAFAHAQAPRTPAHESSLALRVDQAIVRGEWQVSLLELDAPLELDANGDGDVTWPEIEHRRADIEQYLDAHLHVMPNGTDTRLRFEKLLYGTRHGEPFLSSRLTVAAPSAIQSLDVNCSLFIDTPAHRGTVKVVWPGTGSQQTVITSTDGAIHFERASVRPTAFVDLLKSGVWHIWTGYDHVLFLLVLLIPAVFQRTAVGREAAGNFAGPFIRVVSIVSAFTVAHSITLSAAALGWIALPGRLVESAIAASVIIAALVNLLPRTGASGVWVAFGFGLLHGFGFANVLSEINAEGEPVWRTLAGFNLGVEIGQLAIVAVFLPLAYLLRETRFYRTAVLYGGSSAAAAVAAVWLWQRAL